MLYNKQLQWEFIIIFINLFIITFSVYIKKTFYYTEYTMYKDS